MREICIVVLVIFIFACEEERSKSGQKTEEVKVDKIEKYSKVDDILFVDNEFKPNMDYFFELLNIKKYFIRISIAFIRQSKHQNLNQQLEIDMNQNV